MKFSFKITAILFSVFLLSCALSCGIDEIGPSDCYKNTNQFYRDLNNVYNSDMTNIVDQNGNGQSLEACLMRKERTIFYINTLSALRTATFESAGEDGCSSEEINTLVETMDERLDDLNADLEEIWNRCEEVYGNG
jgi:hypothetical protein